jgi:hypothetical protein
MISTSRIALPFTGMAAALLLAIPFTATPLTAQQAEPGPGAAPAPEEIQMMMEEYQQIQQQYGEIQTQAFMSSEDLQERQVAINDMVVDAFFESYPQAEAQMTRLDEIQVEASAAQEAQDMDALGQLMGEAGELQRELQEAQDRVLEREDVRVHIESFEADLMAIMVDIDPEAEQMRDRLDELAAVLSAAMGPF